MLALLASMLAVNLAGLAYFVAGAILSGVAMVLTILIPFRRARNNFV